MRGRNNDVWVTSAVTDDQVEGCLLVGQSLKNVLTNRPLAVIVSPKVSLNLRTLLRNAFDYFFLLEEDRNGNGLKPEEFAKLSTFAYLHRFEKGVYLAPNVMVIKNCDEIFEKYTHFTGLICTKKGNQSVFVLKPSIPVFDALMNGTGPKTGFSFEEYVNLWCANQNGKRSHLDIKYNQIMSSAGSMLIGNPAEISIVNFATNPHDLYRMSNNREMVNQTILDQWKSIYENQVKPMMESPYQKVPHDDTLNDVHYTKEPIAIVGMSCRYPKANNVEEFWKLLYNAEDGTSTPPPFRWSKENVGRRGLENRNTNAGFLHQTVEDFDAKFFGISPKEMVFLDPQHRLLHELVWEGLEDAAINPDILRGTNGGVFIGSWTNDYKDALTHSGNNDFYRSYMGNSIGAAAARISFMLGMTGPSIATESGCSSAMVAVHLACQSLQRGETNMALACGVNLLLHPFNTDVMPMVLSPDGHCKTFDANANGFARAEGCGVLVLKKMSDAVKDGDHVRGLIRGSGISQEGVSKSLGTPTVQCESLAMQQALLDAQIEPELVSYVEAHGTGTTVGDPMEVAAIAEAYHSKNRKEPLIIGSVKTNVGHTESCSGITGIMKVVLSMQHELIPAHLNFTSLNPAINLDAVPAKLPLEPTPWKKIFGKPRYAGVSSFGITGTDAHAIIQEAPDSCLSGNLVLSQFERPQHILKISAKTEEALEKLLEMHANHLETCSDSITDITHTANVGRMDFSYRTAIVGKSREEMMSILKQQKGINGEVTETPGKICFLFTGQGSQYPGMAQQLYSTSPVFRIHFDYCEKVLQEMYHISIKDVIWGEENANKGGGEIGRTIYSQTSIFCVEYALLKLWESWGVKPDFALGHSLGEFAAAVCAGILSVEDAIKLVAERSRLIDQLPRGKMLVIKADKPSVNEAMNKFAAGDKNFLLDYAAINSSQQTVVAGDSDVIMKFSQHCATSNLKCIVLDATHAFHSKHMGPMLNEYKNVAETVEQLIENKCEFISGMRGDVVRASEVTATYWVEHTREKVEFMKASKKAVSLGCQIFIEIGPQPVLSALTMMNNDGNFLCVPSLKRNEDEWTTLLNTVTKLWVKGISFDWNGFDQFYSRKKVSLPNYPFSGKKYWPDINAASGATIHPLIGSVISNASSTKLFQNGFNLRSLEYVKDHAIGQNVIFPGAGYLEMCLAAGLATIEGSIDSLGKPSRPMKVDNLSIEAPLALHESKTCNVQAVVEMSSENQLDLNVNIFHKIESDAISQSKWLRHAQAYFSPLPTAEEQTSTFNINKFFEALTRPSDDDKQIQDVYDKLATLGLKFGPVFRSLEKIWKDESGKTLTAKVKVPVEESGTRSYIVHPAILDAMIQAVMMLQHTGNLKKKLFVPIKIGKFVWLCEPQSEDIYIHAYENTSSIGTALLIDAKGNTLAIMSSVEFIDTTTKAVESVLEQQTITLPDMWEEVWHSKVGPMETSFDMEPLSGKFCSEEFRAANEAANLDPPPDVVRILALVDELVYLNMLQCFYECGWNPVKRQVFDQDTLFQQLQIVAEHRKQFEYFLETFKLEGVIERLGDGTWEIISDPPSLPIVKTRLASPDLTVDLRNALKFAHLLSKLGESLSEIFMGKKSSLPILFPDETMDWPSAGDFYVEMASYFQIEEMITSALVQWTPHVCSAQEDKKVLRVLEVGGGTAAATRIITGIFEKAGVNFEYTFTDISTAFFPPVEKHFEDYGKNFVCKKLNIEEDPMSQGFIPGYYDHIIASDVIHATRDIRESLRNIKLLLKPYGKFDMVEQTKVVRFITYLFGLLDGFWRFTDFDLRPTHCCLTLPKWIEAFNSSGFNVVETSSVFKNNHSFISTHNDPTWDISTSKIKAVQTNSKTWIILYTEDDPLCKFLIDKMTAIGRHVVVVTSGMSFKENGKTFSLRNYQETDFKQLMESINKIDGTVEGVIYGWAVTNQYTLQDELLQPYFYLIKSLSLLSQKSSPRLVALTKGMISLGDEEMNRPYSSTVFGITRSLKNENNEMTCKCINVACGQLDENKFQEVFYDVWNKDKETVVAYQNGIRYTPKFQPHKPICNELALPLGTDRFQLVLPETKSISDLVFGPALTLLVNDNQVEIRVKASALNFRDVFSVLKPTEEFKDVNAIGFDFAGVVTQVGNNVRKWSLGDAVFGVNVHGSALPSHIVMNEDDLQPVPNEITLCDAATLPAVVATAYYCLMEVAKIKPSDTVLLHTASGGVGLSAIQLCQHVGCTIVATAGSKRKQNYLRSLGIQHIFHSRNTKYEQDILQVTNGQGVDVVLNSLTSEGFKEATLKVCSKNARFVEMSKLSIWKPEEVKKLRPDVEYTIADLSSMESSEWKRLMEKLKELVGYKIITPYPYVRFDAVNIREALQFMQKAKHIGKIVCVMPEMRSEGGNVKAHTPMFTYRSTYLITGGLGGIGFEVCKWMVSKGAKHVILAGRSLPSDKMKSLIKHLNSGGANVIPVQLDVGNYEECKHLIQNQIPSMGLPQLRGVMHAAGTLSDGLIANQTWDNLSSTFNTKIDGTINLHELTKSLNMEHFVMFSSLASLFGPPGQSNHAAGNLFEDSFVSYRNSIGLPATSINWGQWGEVGIATEVDLPGIKAISNLQGINAIEYAFKTQRSHTSAVNVESFVLLSKLFPQLVTYLDKKIWQTASTTSSSVIIKSHEFWQQYDAVQCAEEKIATIKTQLRHILKTILKLDDSEVLSDDGNFQEMGIDSLMFVELKNFLQALLGDRVTVNASALRDCANINQLAEALFKLIEGESSAEVPTNEQVSELIREDCVLPDNIKAQNGQTSVEVEKIATVLLTGCSGTLGPYMLRELAKNPQISRIICLMRPSHKVSNENRLTNLLKERNLLHDINMSKVECVTGNVALPQMGMESDIWTKLASSVDAVFHCAAAVQHVEHYRKVESNSDMRAVNIGGTKNVLEFCVTDKLKHVYHASSLLAVTTVDENKRFSESWPNVEDFDNLTTLAYPITKFVGDNLMRQAVERGIPLKSFRFPLISGDSQTGQCVVDQNHLMLRYLFIMKNKKMPSNPFPMAILPVDICANISLDLFFNKKVPSGDVYNILHPSPSTDQEFPVAAEKFGVRVDIVEYSEFSQSIQDSTGGDSPLAIFKDFYSDDDSILNLYTKVSALRYWVEGSASDTFWHSAKVSKYLPNCYDSISPSMDWIYKDLKYAKEEGWFEKFDI